MRERANYFPHRVTIPHVIVKVGHVLNSSFEKEELVLISSLTGAGACGVCVCKFSPILVSSSTESALTTVDLLCDLQD